MTLRLLHRSALHVAPIALCAAFAACVQGEPGESDPVATRESAVGTTYLVGPTRQYTQLTDIVNLVQPGDLVQVDGNATYNPVWFTNNGAAGNPITIQGIRVNGQRPVLAGGVNTIQFEGNHYVFESFEVTGGSNRCVFHHADDITILDTAVHDCPNQGILGADSDSGSLTLQYVEVYNSGAGTNAHSIYMATDACTYPSAVFLMEHCYVHDTTGGNAVKSRAERNEIYYNWIEGALYKEFDLDGLDGQTDDVVRADSDVVGNVFRKTHTQFVGRVGGDGTGDSWGRFRFVNNTFLLMQGSDAVIQLFDGISSVEFHNNVFYRVGGGSVTMFDDEATWTSGTETITGSNNWIVTGSSYPAQWTGTLTGTDPGFVNVANRNVNLLATSPLVDAGDKSPQSPPGFPFVNPLPLPLYLPPPGVIEAQGKALPRPTDGKAIDLSAFEYSSGGASPPPPVDAGAPPPPVDAGAPPPPVDAGAPPPPVDAGAPPPPPDAGTCLTAQPMQWLSEAFLGQGGGFTATVEVTPGAADLDAGVGLSHGAQTAWTGLAAIVRFNDTGTIDVRNGGTYSAAVTMPYVAGKTYQVTFVVEIYTHTYSVYVTPPGGKQVELASNVAFRSEQATVSVLDTFAVTQDATAGTLEACGLVVH